MSDTTMPTSTDAATAETARRALDRLKLSEDAKEVALRFGEDQVEVSLPRAVFENLLEILKHTQHGRAVTLVPIHAELTTQQAAAILNVSRPYVIGLLDAGKIPFRTVGKHRRIRAEDLFAYKKQSDLDTRAAAAELTADAQDLGFY